MVAKGVWYIEHQRHYINIQKDENDEFIYYFLRKDNPLKLKKHNMHFINKYNKIAYGVCQHPPHTAPPHTFSRKTPHFSELEGFKQPPHTEYCTYRESPTYPLTANR